MLPTVDTSEKAAILVGYLWSRFRAVPFSFLLALIWWWLSKLLVKLLIILCGSLIVDWALRKIGFNLPRWW